jgi:hypothetical protein
MWSVRECEGVNTHTPKATPTLGDGVPLDSQNFREQFQGSKHNGLWCSLYHSKSLRIWMSKMGSHCSFGHLKHKLWPEEGRGVKLPIWLPTTKSRESTRFTCLQRACDILLESSQQELQLALNRISIQGLLAKLWGSKVARVPASTISGLPFGSPGREKPFGCRLLGQPQSIL